MIKLRVFDHIRRRLLKDVELPQICPSIGEIVQKQWNSQFERFMKNRLVMGFFRYGSLDSADRKATPYDNIGSAISHLYEYLKTGNQEHLVDAANLCMVEYTVPTCHPRPFWKPQDDSTHTPLR